ncbi:MAG: outer membrane protein assembly factor BamD [bacterium]|nr:outer membrane protein assembly factor BamD [bacterium]
MDNKDKEHQQTIISMDKKILKLVLVLLLLTTLSCSNKKALLPTSAEQRYEKIKGLFYKKKYDKTIEEAEQFLIAYSGASIVDSVQYYLAESHFLLKEFVLAQAEYERLYEQFPSSPLVEIAKFKSALSNYKLSPQSQLDQKYTYLAYDGFQQFLDEFPKSQFKEEAEQLLADCREKLAKKELEAGNLYLKLRKYEAALSYFDFVIDEFYMTKSEPWAYLGKGKVFEILQEYSNALLMYQKVISKYPYSEAARKALQRIQYLSQK